MGALGLLLGCESTRIYAEAQPPFTPLPAQVDAELSCERDDDCPRWLCVATRCDEGRCVGERLPARLSAEGEVALAEGGAATVVVSVGASSELGLLALTAPAPAEALTPDALAAWRAEAPRGVSVVRLARAEGEGGWEARERRAQEPAWLVTGALSDLVVTVEGAGGDALRVAPWREGRPSAGRAVALSGRARAVTHDEEALWVSTGERGVERVSARALEGEEAPARFDTAGRASAARVTRSLVAVADGLAGLSLLSRRAALTEGEDLGARALVTPPAEVPTRGRVVDVDAREGVLLTAEWGAGVGLLQVDPALGARRAWTASLGGEVAGVSLVDPHTALAWVRGRGVLALDLRGAEGPVVLDELPAGASWVSWAAAAGAAVGVTPLGALEAIQLSCGD